MSERYLASAKMFPEQETRAL